MKLWGYVTAGAALAQPGCRLLSAAHDLIRDVTKEVTPLTQLTGECYVFFLFFFSKDGTLNLVLNLLLTSFQRPIYTGCLHRWHQTSFSYVFVRLKANRDAHLVDTGSLSFSLTFSHPYVRAVPEVLWTTEQIVGYFIGKTVRQLATHHKAKQMCKWLVEEVNGNFFGSGKELEGARWQERKRCTGKRETSIHQYSKNGRKKPLKSSFPITCLPFIMSKRLFWPQPRISILHGTCASMCPKCGSNNLWFNSDAYYSYLGEINQFSVIKLHSNNLSFLCLK